MTVEKPLVVTLLRNNEMTMDQFFTHLAWPGRDGRLHMTTFDDRKPLLQKEPIAADAPWLAFLNLEKGYGYGFVMLDYKATGTPIPTLASPTAQRTGNTGRATSSSGNPPRSNRATSSKNVPPTSCSAARKASRWASSFSGRREFKADLGQPEIRRLASGQE